MTTGIFLHHGMCFDFRVIADVMMNLLASEQIDVMIDFRGLLFPIAPDLVPTISKPGKNKIKQT